MATPAQRNTDELPIIALVGRVNVGKSTLFNRLVEADHALVSANPGTTRNNNEGAVRWRGTYARLIDTLLNCGITIKIFHGSLDSYSSYTLSSDYGLKFLIKNTSFYDAYFSI